MSRKWIWRCDKIYERDQVSCLGLLEDLHRFHDGLPRRSDPSYFKDGPYIVLDEPSSTPQLRSEDKILNFGALSGANDVKSKANFEERDQLSQIINITSEKHYEQLQ